MKPRILFLIFASWLGITFATGIAIRNGLIPLEIHPWWAFLSAAAMVVWLFLALESLKSQSREEHLTVYWMILGVGGMALTGLAAYMGFLPFSLHRVFVWGALAFAVWAGIQRIRKA